MFVRRAQLASIGLLVGASVLFGTGLAYAQVPDVNVDVPMPEVDVNVSPDTPSASEINCEIFAQLMANGLPIPQGFDASGCEGGGGGGGGGSTPACADGIDNDSDGLVDSADPGCSGSTDNDESNTTGGGGNGGGDNGGGSGGGSGGNSGGPAPACEDSVDNDGDGLKDMNDPGCSSASDNDETNSASGGGGGGGGGSASSTAATTTETTSASSTLEMVASCDMYLTAFIKPGANNDAEQVKRLQSLLNESEGAALEVDGIYGAQTIAAVHVFQTKYAADILAPWGVTKSTGFVYLTTRKKANEIYCKLTKEFPLTSEEAETIAKTKVEITAPSTPSRPGVPATPSIPDKNKKVDEKEVGSASKETQTAAAGETATRSLNRLWEPVTTFFRRVFGR